MKTKICSVCGKEKDISEFHKDARGILGVRADCKLCRSIKNKKPKEEHLPNVSLEPKKCIDCNNNFIPKSNRQLRCNTCQILKQKQTLKDYYRRTYKPKGYAHLKLRNANSYKDGIGIYQKLKRLSMNELKCERCGSMKYLLVHHKNRNRHDNCLHNLELLCKSCHQKEHLVRDNRGKFIGSR